MKSQSLLHEYCHVHNKENRAFLLAVEVHDILLRRGIRHNFNICESKYGTSCYYYLHEDDQIFGRKIRISDHSVTSHHRIFNEEHFYCDASAVTIADRIERHYHPERYHEWVVDIIFYNQMTRERLELRDYENNMGWAYKYIKEMPEHLYLRIRDSGNVRNFAAEFVRESKKGTKLYNVAYEVRVKVYEHYVLQYQRKSLIK